jgi:hypothetical protein
MLTTDDTNKTYNKTILIKAYNSNQKNVSVSIKIPHKEITGDLTTDVAVLEYLEKYFCPANPCSLLCGGLNSANCNSSSSSSSSNSTLTANMSSVDLYNMLKDMASMRDQMDREENERKASEEAERLSREETQKIANESLTIQKQNEKKTQTMYNVIWIIVFGVVLLVSTIYVINELNKKGEKFAGIRRFVRYRGDRD